jgi:2,3-bisphosphoglycerate-dependent phosphoglycerate mutase
MGAGILGTDLVTVDLVRHGATQWSSTGRFTGRIDLPLSANGRREAIALGERLQQREYATVWCSPLVRAVESASLAGFDPRIDARLAEFDFGDIEGSSWDDLSTETQKALTAFDSFTAPGGESVGAFKARVFSWWEELLPGRHLAFCHGGVIRVMQRHLGAESLTTTGTVVSLPGPDGLDDRGDGNRDL